MRNKIHAALAIDSVWAIHRQTAEAMSYALAETPADMVAEEDKKPFSVINDDGIAFIRMEGVMMRHRSSFGGGCSTVETRRALRQAANDPMVKEICLVINSPGGAVSGTADLAADVRKATKYKKVTAYIEDMCCSAALWVASQASDVVASPSAMAIGSIGVYTVFYDQSAQYEKEGVKPILISSGGIKGKPVSGLPIEDETVEDLNDHILKIYECFVDAVADGRGMSTEDVLSLADGRTWFAPEAETLGLIDRIADWDDLISGLGAEEPLELCSEESMNILDNFRKSAAKTPADVEAVENPLENPMVIQVVETRISKEIDGFIAANNIVPASKDAASNLLQAIAAEGGVSVENGCVVFGQAFEAAVEFINSQSISSVLDKPVISGSAVVEPSPKSEENPANKQYADAAKKGAKN